MSRGCSSWSVRCLLPLSHKMLVNMLTSIRRSARCGCGCGWCYTSTVRVSISSPLPRQSVDVLRMCAAVLTFPGHPCALHRSLCSPGVEFWKRTKVKTALRSQQQMSGASHKATYCISIMAGAGYASARV